MKYTLEELYRKGLISHRPIVFRDVQAKINELMAVGMKRSKAIGFVAIELGCSTRTIYRALKAKF